MVFITSASSLASDGTNDDIDFNVTLPMEFIFEPEEQMKSILLSVIDDNQLEPPENFALTLFTNISIPNVIIQPSLATFDIIDNEGI